MMAEVPSTGETWIKWVQRKATNMVRGLLHLSCEDRLRAALERPVVAFQTSKGSQKSWRESVEKGQGPTVLA